MLEWIKEHLMPMLSSGFLFGLGGVYSVHKSHGEKIKKLEDKEENRDKLLMEMHGDIKVLLDRTGKND